MVSDREVMKKRLEEDLAKKISGAEELLRSLREAAAQVHVNARHAKEEVNVAYDAMHAKLVNRKGELTRQIDLISNSQINSLQEGSHAILIALGSLQATLKNLESFDNTQLLHLHIPDLSLCSNVPVSPAPIEVTFEEETALHEMSRWGNVTAKGVKGLVDVGSTASMPKRYVEYNDEKAVHELMSHKPVTGASASVIDFKVPPKLPYPTTSCKEHASHLPKPSNLKEFCLEDWLLDLKKQNCLPALGEDIDEDFEFVDIAAKEQEILGLEQDLIRKCTVNNSTTEDLSKWLCRPRKRPFSQSPQPNCLSKYSVLPVSSSSPEQMCNTPNNFTSRKAIIEFPCLQINDADWIAPKKTKQILEKPLFNTNHFVPPEYTLPTPFWLKKKVPKSS